PLLDGAEPLRQGNERTSVGRSWPRKARFKRRIVGSSTRHTVKSRRPSFKVRRSLPTNRRAPETSTRTRHWLFKTNHTTASLQIGKWKIERGGERDQESARLFICRKAVVHVAFRHPAA